MKHVVQGIIGMVLLIGATSALAESEHEHGGHDHGMGATGQQAMTGSPQEQTLTGEVTDVFCYLSHPAEGIGPKHASCAKKCIKSGLPVAIKVGNQLYLATMNDHNPANQQLAEFAGQIVSVRGTVMELDGQRLIAISSVQKTQ
ncbi:MAG: hypothetical protein HY352_02220 [Candidatus Omnitrophica bacterium]|nr:hypothetical protein [Candidatus Omnitrophota bacterium]